MEVNDASSRILAGLLETRTGQQLTISRRWRIETALKSLMRERDIATLDQLIAILVAGREPGLAEEVVDALLNNAAMRPDGKFLEMSEADFDRVVDTDYKAAYWLARASIPAMLE